MVELLEQTKKYISDQVYENRSFFIGNAFSKYQKVYFNTNENIKAYLENINFKNKSSALTVLSSGDHVLNLLKKGILNIDTFDINKLTEYYVFGIRFACVLKYNYEKYLEVLNKFSDEKTSLEEITSIINDLLPLMDLKYRMFWKEINKYNYNIQKENNTNLNLFHLITLGRGDINKIILRNDYLSDKKSFDILKNNLNKSNITFKNMDVIDLPNEYNNNYDYILLSNIFDYLYKVYGVGYNYSDIKEYLESLKNILNKDGIIFLNYIFNYKTKSFTRKNIIDNADMLLSDIPNSSIISFINSNKKIEDAMVLVKKK